jgi:hypothetical protein
MRLADDCIRAKAVWPHVFAQAQHLAVQCFKMMSAIGHDWLLVLTERQLMFLARALLPCILSFMTNVCLACRLPRREQLKKDTLLTARPGWFGPRQPPVSARAVCT